MKDTLRLVELLEGQIENFSETGIYEIERDLLLERLRGVYASVLALDVVTEEDRVIDALLGVVAGVADTEECEAEMEIERIYPSEPQVEAAKDVLEEEAIEEEAIEEEAPEESPEEQPMVVEFEVSPEEAEQPEEVVEEEPELPAEEPAVEQPVMGEIDHQKAMSLYDDDDDDDDDEGEVLYVAEEEDEEEAEEEDEKEACDGAIDESEQEDAPVEEQSEEVVDGGATEGPAEVSYEQQPEERSFEGYVEPQIVDVATAASASMSLRQSIGINDKFILMRDLFAGDNDYYEESISKLDEFDNLDEAMLYIYDNFHWTPNSEGARLLMELMARKLF